MSIEQAKQINDIIEVAERLGITVNKSGKALCPFHNDKNPSLQFSREKQIATCFSGNCSAGTMDVISLVSKKLNINTSEVLKYLVGSTDRQLITTGEKSLLEKIEITSAASFKQSKPARSYAELRGLIGKQHFLGETFYQGWDESQREQAERIGLIKKYRGSFYRSAFKNRLVYFLRDRNNQPVSVYGRAIDERNEVKHLYLKNGQKGLFPCYSKANTSKLILTESIIDAASLLQFKEAIKGYGILSLYGTNGLTNEHLEAIKSLKKLEEIIFFFDGDKAGNTAIEKYLEEFKALVPGITISKVGTPDGEDINSLVVGHSEAEELLNHLLKERSTLSVPPKGESQECVESSPLSNTNEKSSFRGDLEGLNTSNPNNIIYQTSTAFYSIKGGIGKGFDSMKVTLVVANNNNKSRLKLDLYEDKQVIKSAREISEKLGLDMAKIEQDLNRLTDELEQYRDQIASGGNNKKEQEISSLSSAEKGEALKLLKSKSLMKKVNELIGKSGIVGEESARQALFIIACSYLIKKPLHGLIQGSSGSGKTHLMNKVLDLLPKHKVVRITRVTESSFYNYEENFFNHKVLGMEDLDGLEEKALFAFRELQSKGEITSSTTVKDELTGELSAGIRKVKGPIASLSCTTKGEIYEDNMSRSFLIAVNESVGQTAKILQYQQNKAAGLINESQEQQAAQQIQNTLSLLKPFNVINPFATKLQLPKEAHKIRRLHELFQYFVQTITVVNQYQRRRASAGNNTIITEKEDVKQAIEIMFDSIMLKVDELDGSLRNFYEQLKGYVKEKGEEESFSAREVRHTFLISKTQLHRYLNDLLELEYIEKVNGHKNVGYRYKISYWDNIEKLRNTIKTYLNKQLENL